MRLHAAQPFYRASQTTGKARLWPQDCHSCLNLRPWVTSVVPVEPLVWLRWPMERVWAGGLDYAVGGTAEALRWTQTAQLYYKAGLTPGNPCRRLSHLPTSSTFEPQDAPDDPLVRPEKKGDLYGKVEHSSGLEGGASASSQFERANQRAGNARDPTGWCWAMMGCMTSSATAHVVPERCYWAEWLEQARQGASNRPSYKLARLQPSHRGLGR